LIWVTEEFSLLKIWRAITRSAASTSAPTSRDRKNFEKVTVRYLTRQGWHLTDGLPRQYWGFYGRRRVLIIFFYNERETTTLHIMDWNEHRVRAGGRQTYVFAQVPQHEAFIKLAAERGITLRSYVDASIPDLTERDHIDEAVASPGVV